MCLLYLSIDYSEFMGKGLLNEWLNRYGVWLEQDCFIIQDYYALEVANKFLDYNGFICFGAGRELYSQEKVEEWREEIYQKNLSEANKELILNARIWEAKRATKLFEEDYALWMKVFQGYLEKHSQIGIYYAYEEDRRYHKVIPIQFKEVTKDVIASLEAHTLLLIHR